MKILLKNLKTIIMNKKLALLAVFIFLLFIPIIKTDWYAFLLIPFQKIFEHFFPSSPQILEAKVEPEKVEPSDYMIITALIRDEYGIKEVIANMANIENVSLTLISGNETYGTWQGKWFVHSVEVGKSYNATIIARNVKGRESFFVVQFHDDPVFCCRRQINVISSRSLGISITLDTRSLIAANKMRSDCGDIRFTDSKSFDSALWTRNFSYNLNSTTCNSNSTIISVEVPSGVTSFYVYYGNPAVTSISNSSVSHWLYRRAITINNTANSNNLTDYQVLITLNTASLTSQGKMRSDCGDIRFTDSDGTTLLSYWIESGCNTNNTRIWVKVPNIPASSTKTIYVYYGNPSATNQSNGFATFLAFDLKAEGPLGFAGVGGDSHSCAIASNGSAYCWGRNDYGQLGDGTNDDRTTPVKVVRYDMGGIYDKTRGIYSIPNPNTDVYFVRKYTSPEPTTSAGLEETIATIGPEETWIRISGGINNILIIGGGGNITIK